MLYFASFMIAMLSTMALIPPLIKLAPKWQFVDIPDERKVHVNAIPRIGGVAMVIGALLALFFILPYSTSNIALITGIVVILAFGIWDDRKNLDFRIKFVGQIIASLIVIGWADVRIKYIPFWDVALPFSLSAALTLFVILAVTNAMNLVDGLDGLAGGTTLLSLGTTALLAWLVEQSLIVGVSLAVMGSILGFLRFNTHPASVFMGDSGSQFLGFTLAVLLIVLTQHSEVSLSLSLPLVIAGLPILDTVSVMVKRISEGRSPFSPDKNHIHHRLLKIGMAHYQVVITIYLAQTLLVVAAYAMRFYSDFYIIAFYVVYSFFLLGGLMLAERHGGALNQLSYAPASTGLGRWMATLKKVMLFTAWFLLILYSACTLYAVPHAMVDFKWVATGVAITAAGLILLRGNNRVAYLERPLFYSALAIIVFLAEASVSDHWFKGFEPALFFYLAFVVVYAFLFGQNRVFRLTPLDVLLLIIVVVLNNLSFEILVGHSLGLFALKIAVIFYAIELLLNSFQQHGIIWRLLLLAEGVSIVLLS